MWSFLETSQQTSKSPQIPSGSPPAKPRRMLIHPVRTISRSSGQSCYWKFATIPPAALKLYLLVGMILVPAVLLSGCVVIVFGRSVAETKDHSRRYVSGPYVSGHLRGRLTFRPRALGIEAPPGIDREMPTATT
jgi:hypothetical protein